MAKDGVHNRDDFLRYIRYFNESKDEEKHTFYGDNVSLALPLTALLEGNAAIAKHYNFIHEMAEERLDVVELLFDKEQDPTRIFLMTHVYFRFKRDQPHEPHFPFPAKKGDLRMMETWIFYELNADGTMGRISCTSTQSVNLGQVGLPAPAHDRVIRQYDDV